MIYAALSFVCAPFLLWCAYIGIMNAKRVRDAGQLSKPAYYLANGLLFIGYLLDVLVNIVHMTILLAEFPREWIVTARLNRHIATGSGWRYERCLAIRTKLLDNFDPAGIHR